MTIWLINIVNIVVFVCFDEFVVIWYVIGVVSYIFVGGFGSVDALV